MRILFEASWWLEGPPSLKRALRESVFAWSRLFPGDELVLIVPRRDRAAAQKELGPSVVVRSTRLRPQALAAMFGTIGPSIRLRPDAVFTHNFTSLTPRARRVVLIHDFMFCEHPEWFTRLENLYFALMPLTAQFASLVLSTSETEAHRVSRYLRGRKVKAVGLGLSPELSEHHPATSGIAGVNGLAPGRFVLSVGRLNARKNLMVTIEAALAAGVLRPDHPLVVVGSADGLQDEVSPGVRDAINAGLVRYTGFVKDEELAWLYANCRLFTFLSLDEGYGLPPLEALHFNAQVLVSDIPVFRELLPAVKCVRFCDPHDRTAIAAAMKDMIETPADPSLSADSVIGHAHSWDDVVAKMRTSVLKVSGRPMRSVDRARLSPSAEDL